MAACTFRRGPPAEAGFVTQGCHHADEEWLDLGLESRRRTRSLPQSNRLPTSASLKARAQATAAIAASNADAVDREARFPARSVRLGASGAPPGHSDTPRARRRRRQPLRRRGRLLHARPRMRVDSHDLCHASDQDRLFASPRARQCVAPAPAAPHLQRAIAAGVFDHGRSGRGRRSQEQRSGRATRLPHCSGKKCDGHFLRRASRWNRNHRAPLSGRASVGPGARRIHEGRLFARARSGVGHPRHARHLQRRVHAQGDRRARADPARPLREDSSPDHGTGRPPRLERGLDRYRRRCGGARSPVYPRCRPSRRGPAPARCSPSHPCQRLA